jgi:thiamine biosynthesis protein ThiS
LQVEINGERRMVEEQMTLSDLIEHLSLAPERLAIELNQRVVRRADWPHTPLKDGDRIEIVHFVGGGGKARMKDEGGRMKVRLP